MPHYFFNIRTRDDELVEDDEGIDLKDLEAACFAAQILAKRFAAATKKGGLDYVACCFEVMSDDGHRLNLPLFADGQGEEDAVIMLV